MLEFVLTCYCCILCASHAVFASSEESVNLDVIFETSLLVSWEQSVVSSHDEVQLSLVVEDGREEYFKKIVPSVDIAFIVANIPQNTYFIIASFLQDGSIKKILPSVYFLISEEAVLCDFLVKLQPNDETWKYDGTGWNLQKMNIDSLSTDLKDGTSVVSSSASSMQYSSFVVISQKSTDENSVLTTKIVSSSAMKLSDVFAFKGGFGRIEKAMLNRAVEDGNQNIALNKDAETSSFYSAANKGFVAVDGLKATTDEMIHSAADENEPWLRIDFGRSSLVLKAMVYNRGGADTTQDRLTNFKVFVGEDTDYNANKVCAHNTDSMIGVLVADVPCALSLNGRYVHLVIMKETILHILEMEVYGYEGLQNLALYGTATSSSVHDGMVPEKAIDGIIMVGDNYMFTGADTPSWLRVELRKKSYILKVVVFNRYDCCRERLSNFKVHVGDDNNGGANPLCGSYGVVSSEMFKVSLTCPKPMLGSYVQLILDNAEYLNINELETIGYEEFDWTTDSTYSHSHEFESPKGKLNVLIDNTYQMFGIGYETAPYIGFSRNHMVDLTPVIDPSPVVMLGVHDNNVAGTPLQSACESDLECGEGLQKTFSTVQIDGASTKVFAYSTTPDDVCFFKECPFDAPLNLRLVSATSSSIEITWDAIDTSLLVKPDGFSHYIIEMENTETLEKKFYVEKTTTKLIDQLAIFTTYAFMVSGSASDVNGEWSNVQSFATVEEEPTGTASDFEAIALNYSHVALSWTHIESDLVLGDFKGYQLTYKSSNKEMSMNISKVEEFMVEGLSQNTVYKFELRARNGLYIASLFAQSEAKTPSATPILAPTNVKAFNTSSTSLQVTWDDIHDDGWQKAERAGFNLTVTRENVFLSFFIEYDTFSYEVNELTMFTEYNIQVAGVNRHGVGVYSSPVSAKTDEAGPILSPEVTQIETISANQVLLSWKLFSTDLGIVRSYTIQVRPTGTENRKRRDVNDPNTGQVITVNVPETNYTIGNLLGSTNYEVNMAANTLYPGTSGEWMAITTLEGVPLKPVTKVECVMVDLQSVLIRWQPAPVMYNQGALTNYRVYYTHVASDDQQIMYDNADDASAQLNFLTPLEEYDIKVSAFTSAGEGNKSVEDVKCTPQGIPGSAPLNIAAESQEGSSHATVSWEAVTDWNAFDGKGYLLHLEHLSHGVGLGTSVPRDIRTGDVTSYYLEELYSYSTYQVSVAACAEAGCGRTSESVAFETCRLSSLNVLLSYAPLLPFVYNDTSTTIDGTLVDITRRAVSYCSLACKDFTPDELNFTYEPFSFPAKFKSLTTNRILMPVIGATVSADISYAEIYKTPGFALVSSPTDSADEGEKMLTGGIVKIIPLIAFYFIATAIFGIFYWILDTCCDTRVGQCWALRGCFEGAYFSFMTSTTVGYGDFYPRSIRGRIYTMFWSLIGLVLTGIVVGNLSSDLTKQVVKMLTAPGLPTEKVIAVYRSPAYFFADKYIGKFERNVTLHSADEVLAQLRDRHYRYAFFDMLTAQLYGNRIKDYGLSMKATYDVPNAVRVAFFGDLTKYATCVSMYAKENQHLVEDKIDEILKRYMVDAIEKNSTAVEIVEDSSPGVIVSWKSKLYQRLMFFLVVIWVSLNVIGGVYECVCRCLHRRKGLHAQLRRYRRLRKRFVELKQGMTELIEGLESRTCLLEQQHNEEILAYHRYFTKVYGIEIALLNINDVSVTSKEMANYTQSLKRSKRKPSLD